MGAPGCPRFACCAASIAWVRIVLMHSVSNCVPVTTACSLTAMRCVLLPGNCGSSLGSLTDQSYSPLEFPGQKEFQIRTECTKFLAETCCGTLKNQEGLRKVCRKNED